MIMCKVKPTQMLLNFTLSRLMQSSSKSSFDLPIKKYKRQILYAIQQNDITIIIAETGTGKTTQIPQFLIQSGHALQKRICIALPRRIACTSICKRVCEQTGFHNGQIAYQIRFNTNENEQTKVKFVTDGMLVQTLYSDPLLEEYSVVMLDDVHERSISTDILLGFLKKIMRKRRDLKVIVASATMEGDRIKGFFQKKEDYREDRELKVEVVNIAGRLYPVDVYYLAQPTKNYLLKAFQTVTYIQQQKPKGDILIFLTSQQQILAMQHLLQTYSQIKRRSLNLIPLFSSLPQQKQQRAFQPSLQRKIIIATNIAESSITLNNLHYVVDCGFVKIKVWDNEKAVETMVVVPCGKSSARQRMGRAGRVKRGECYRVYTREGFEKMQEALPPEIQRVDLANFILKLRGLGIADISSFQLIDPPTQYALIKGVQQLFAYGLINQNFDLTDIGSKVAELSLDIKLATMLVNSFDVRFGCSEEILILVSMLSVERDVFQATSTVGVLKTKKKVGAKEGDFATLVNIFLRYKNAKPTEKRKLCLDLKLNPSALDHASKIHSQIAQQLKSFNRFKSTQQLLQSQYGTPNPNKLNFHLKSSHDDIQPILRCILTGYFMNVAQLQPDGSYRNIRSKQTLWLHPTSVLTVVYPEWIVYYEIVKNNKYYLYHASKIQFQWIFELAGHYYKDSRKKQAEEKYGEEMEVLEKVVERREEKKFTLVSIGERRRKEGEKQGFKTSVLGLKDKTELLKGKKQAQLSFDYQDI